MENTKICSKCGRELPLTEYYKNKKHKDGCLNICKMCFNSRAKEHYHTNVEQYKQYYQDNKDEKIEYGKQYYEEHKEERVEYSKNYNKAYNKTQSGRASYLAQDYKREDKKYNRDNNIDRQWIVDNIFTSKCEYCGETDWRELGCDRIDNSIGHIIGNVVCCCEKCNNERQKKSFEEFYTLKKGS